MVYGQPPKTGHRLRKAMEPKPELNRPFYDLLTQLAEKGALVSGVFQLRRSSHFLATPQAAVDIQNAARAAGFEVEAVALGKQAMKLETQNGKYDVSAHTRRITYKALHQPLGDSRVEMTLKTAIQHPPLTPEGVEMRKQESKIQQMLR